MKKVHIIDGNAIMYRAYFAVPSMFGNHHRINTNALYGFAQSLMSYWDNPFVDEFPTHLSVIFDDATRSADGTKPCFRNEIYPEYKMNRSGRPDDLIEQVPFMHKLCEAFQVPVYCEPYYEADDVIATLTRQARDDGAEVVVVSPDKDMLQLIDHGTRVYDPVKKEFLTSMDAHAKFGVSPDQVTLVQALMGDKSDNIPGAMGVGAKTAAKLISDYGDLNGVWSALERGEIKGALANKLTSDWENVLVSLQLATLKDDVPLEHGYASTAITAFRTKDVLDFFDDVNFKSLRERFTRFVDA